LIVGLAVAAVGATFAQVLRAHGLFEFAPARRVVSSVWKLPYLVLFDFGLVTWTLVRALARGRRVEGRWVTVPYPIDGGAEGRWERALAVSMANGAANAIVVDMGERE